VIERAPTFIESPGWQSAPPPSSSSTFAPPAASNGTSHNSAKPAPPADVSKSDGDEHVGEATDVPELDPVEKAPATAEEAAGDTGSPPEFGDDRPGPVDENVQP
jgi:hypothetical protein